MLINDDDSPPSDISTAGSKEKCLFDSCTKMSSSGSGVSIWASVIGHQTVQRAILAFWDRKYTNDVTAGGHSPALDGVIWSHRRTIGNEGTSRAKLPRLDKAISDDDFENFLLPTLPRLQTDQKVFPGPDTEELNG